MSNTGLTDLHQIWFSPFSLSATETKSRKMMINRQPDGSVLHSTLSYVHIKAKTKAKEGILSEAQV